MKKRGKRGERELEASSSRAAAKKKKRKRPFRFKRLFLLSSLFFSLRELSHRVEQLGGLFQRRVGGGDFQRGGLDCEKGKRKRRGMSFRTGRATKRGRCSRLSLSGARSLSLSHFPRFSLLANFPTCNIVFPHHDVGQGHVRARGGLLRVCRGDFEKKIFERRELIASSSLFSFPASINRCSAPASSIPYLCIHPVRERSRHRRCAIESRIESKKRPREAFDRARKGEEREGRLRCERAAVGRPPSLFSSLSLPPPLPALLLPSKPPPPPLPSP